MDRKAVKKLILDSKLELLDDMASLAEAFTKKMENKDKDWTTHIQKLWEMNSMIMFQNAVLSETLFDKGLLTVEDLKEKSDTLAAEAEGNGAEVVQFDSLFKKKETNDDGKYPELEVVSIRESFGPSGKMYSQREEMKKLLTKKVCTCVNCGEDVPYDAGFVTTEIFAGADDAWCSEECLKGCGVYIPQHK